MADPINTLYRDANNQNVRYLEAPIGVSLDGFPLRLPRSVPSTDAGASLFTLLNPGHVSLDSSTSGIALDTTAQTIAQAIVALATANHTDLGALLTRLGQALTVQGTVNVGNLPATQAVSATALPLPTGAAKDTTIAGIVTALGNPLQAGGTVTATQSGAWTVALGAGSASIGTVSLATGTTITANLGTLNGAALDTSVQAVKTALGSPFQAGGLIANTAFGISGSLPAGTNTIGTVNVQGGNTTAVQVAGGAAAGAAPVNPPLSISGVDGGGLKRHILTDATGIIQTAVTGTAAISATALPLPTGASTSALQTTGNTSLASIVTALAGTLKVISPLAAPITGQAKIVTTGTPVQLPSVALVNGLAIKAKMTNAAQGTNYSGMVGGSTVTTTYDGTGTGYPLAPGEGVSLAIANANQVYVNGTAGDVFTYSGN